MRASITAKELNKNKLGIANHADTIQPKSIDGLQNHAETQKLIQIKTAADQSNRHEKLTQLKSMGDARAQKIQNEGVTQLMFGRALNSAARNAPKLARAGAALTGGLAVADHMSGASTGFIMGDKNKIAKHSFALAGTAVEKMKISSFLKSAAEGFFETLEEEAETFPFEGTTNFDDTQNQKIVGIIRDFSDTLTKNDIPNPLAAFVSLDNIQSRFFALAEVVKNVDLEANLSREKGDKEIEGLKVGAPNRMAEKNPEVYAHNRSFGDDF